MSIEKLLDYDRRNPEGAGSSEEEKLFLYSLCRMVKPSVIIEVGVSRGHLTTWFALACKDNQHGRVISVDNWSKAHGGGATSSIHAEARLRALHCGLEGLVKFVASDSVEYLESCNAASVDFVWIDGDHSQEGATADIAEALRVARKVVGVHDTNQLYIGPRAAITWLDGKSSGFWVRGCRGIWLRNIGDE